MGFLDYLRNQIRNGASELVKDVRQEISHKINLEISKIQQRIMRELSSLAILLIGIIFLSIAVVYFFIEYLLLTKTISFLIVGVILLFIGIIIRLIK